MSNEIKTANVIYWSRGRHQPPPDKRRRRKSRQKIARTGTSDPLPGTGIAGIDEYA